VLLATKVATAVGYILAAELRACGIDMSFTPVLDLDYGHSKVIGDRAFHRDPRVVTLLAKSLNHGLSLAGMANCGKHFPGMVSRKPIRTSRCRPTTGRSTRSSRTTSRRTTGSACRCRR
jgi:beta-glucosidase-like glycosyl hydrolase